MIVLLLSLFLLYDCMEVISQYIIVVFSFVCVGECQGLQAR